MNHEIEDGIKSLLPDPMTVMIVDDEQNVLRSLVRILRREPYRLVSAGSGAEALELLEQEPVHMIVSDQRMPGMTGTEFLARVREKRPDVIRVILTGFSDLKTAEEAINQVEIYRFLFKPWNDEDLKATIRQGLNKWKLEAENQLLVRALADKNQELRDWNLMLEQKVEERTRALKDAQGQLVQSEKMASLGVLAGGVAHELNNPLGGIIGITQLLLDDLEPEEQLAKDLTIINNAALHCSGIVKNLLGFARKEGKDKRTALSLTEVVDDVMSLVGYQFRKQQVEVEPRFAPDFPELLVNGQQMKQVMLNLLTNALQAMNGTGRITVRGFADERGRWVVEVEDEGPGIKPEATDKIFDPFFTTKPEGQGTGLGLSICYQIMKDHGGTITARNGVPRGAVISLAFPPNLAAAATPASRSDVTSAIGQIYDLQAGSADKP